MEKVKMAGKKDLYGAEVLQWQGKPVLKLFFKSDARFQLLFGVAKAKLIMGSIADIKKFIEDNDEKLVYDE